MELADTCFKSTDLLSRRLDHQLALVSVLYAVLPAVHRSHWRQHVDARRKPFLNQLRREFLRVAVDRKSSENNDEASHARKPVARKPAALQSTERLFEIGLQIFNVLDADGDADQSIGDAQHLAAILRHRGVRHDRRM